MAFDPKTNLAYRQQRLQEKQVELANDPGLVFLKAMAQSAPQATFSALGQMGVNTLGYYALGGKEDMQTRQKTAETARMAENRAKIQQDIDVGLKVPELREIAFGNLFGQRSLSSQAPKLDSPSAQSPKSTTTKTGDYFLDQELGRLPRFYTSDEVKDANTRATEKRNESVKEMNEFVKEATDGLSERFLEYGAAASPTDVKNALNKLEGLVANLTELYGEKHPTELRMALDVIDSAIINSGVNEEGIAALKAAARRGKAGQIASNQMDALGWAKVKENRVKDVIRQQTELDKQAAGLAAKRKALIDANILNADGSPKEGLAQQYKDKSDLFFKELEDHANNQESLVSSLGKLGLKNSFTVSPNELGVRRVMVLREGEGGQASDIRKDLTSRDLLSTGGYPGAVAVMIDNLSDDNALSFIKSVIGEEKAKQLGSPESSNLGETAKNALKSYLTDPKNSTSKDFQNLLGKIQDATSENSAEILGVSIPKGPSVSNDKIRDYLNNKDKVDALVSRIAEENNVSREQAEAVLFASDQSLRSLVAQDIYQKGTPVGKSKKERTAQAEEAVAAFRDSAKGALPQARINDLVGQGMAKEIAGKVINNQTLSPSEAAHVLELYKKLPVDSPIVQFGTVESDFVKEFGSFVGDLITDPSERLKFKNSTPEQRNSIVTKKLVEK